MLTSYSNFQLCYIYFSFNMYLKTFKFDMFVYDLELIPRSAGIWRNLPEVRHLLRVGISSTRAGRQDDVSFDKLPQTITPACDEKGFVIKTNVWVIICPLDATKYDQL